MIAGEEAGPASNKMGGIWNVIHEEAHTLAALFDSGKLKAKENTEILIAGPYFGHRGADWNRGLNRITNMDGLAPLSADGELKKSLKTLENEGIKVFTGEEMVGETRIGYLQFQTSDFGKIRSSYMGKEMTLESRIKAEAYELLELDSLKYENFPNGPEYTHYLSLSHSISELSRLLVSSAPRTADTWQKKQVRVKISFPVPGFPFTATSLGHFTRLQDLKKTGNTGKQRCNPARHSARQGCRL